MGKMQSVVTPYSVYGADTFAKQKNNITPMLTKEPISLELQKR